MQGEWSLVCLTYNLLKLFAATMRLPPDQMAVSCCLIATALARPSSRSSKNKGYKNRENSGLDQLLRQALGEELLLGLIQ